MTGVVEMKGLTTTVTLLSNENVQNFRSPVHAASQLFSSDVRGLQAPVHREILKL
jgi:hypothetical protein